jgi:predicted ArsR family transcriptional regulator
MTSTRQLILDYLNSKQIGTAPELARAIKMTTANARHHLSILLKEGAVAVVGEHHTKDRGRPSLLYALSTHTHQHNLDRLSDALLTDLLSNESPQEIKLTLKRIARRLLRDHEIKASLPQRLYQAVRRLNDMQYNARWEAHVEAPTIIFGFCPYAGILAEHPEMCELDTHLIQELLGRPALQVDKLANDERGATYCRFIIQEGRLGD